MALEAAKRTDNDEAVLPLYDNNAGTNRANAPRGYKQADLNGEPVAELGVYPTSGSARTGKRSTTASTALAISASSIPCQGVIVKADPANGDTVFVGISTVTVNGTEATDGYPLAAGESVGVPCRNVNEIFIRRAGSVNVAVYWIASAD